MPGGYPTSVQKPSVAPPVRPPDSPSKIAISPEGTADSEEDRTGAMADDWRRYANPWPEAVRILREQREASEQVLGEVTTEQQQPPAPRRAQRLTGGKPPTRLGHDLRYTGEESYLTIAAQALTSQEAQLWKDAIERENLRC